MPEKNEKEKKYSDAGKGDKSRVDNFNKYAENWEKIFGKKSDKDGDSIQVDKE
jgi:hypothetical protein